MKPIFVILIFLIITGEGLCGEQRNVANDVAKLLIHEPEYLRQTIGVPIEIYDNKNLKGSPVYIVDNNSFTDFRFGKKIYDYTKYYRKKKSNEVENEDESIFEVLTSFPVDFVKIGRFGYLIPIESKEGDIAKITSRDLYFSLTNKNLKHGENTAIEWQEGKATLEEVKRFINENNDFKKFMNDLLICTKKKDEKCLFEISNKFKDAAQEWTLYHDQNFCEKIDGGVFSSDVYRKEIENIKKLIINWPLYEKLAVLKSQDIKVGQYISNYGNTYHLFLSVLGERAKCGSVPKIEIDITKEKGKKVQMNLSLMAGEAS